MAHGDLTVVVDEWVASADSVPVMVGFGGIIVSVRVLRAKLDEARAQVSRLTRAFRAGCDPDLIRDLIEQGALEPATPARGSDDTGP